MIAQCTTCGETFTTETWGVQTCPHCGTKVFLEPDDVSEEPQPGAEPAGGEGEGEAEAPPPEHRTPFEDTSLPFPKRFWDTWSGSMTHPIQLFQNMLTTDSRGGLLYAWLCTTLGGEMVLLWGRLQMQSGGWKAPPGLMPEQARVYNELMPTMKLVYGHLGFLLMPVVTIVAIFLLAGLVHLGALMFGANNRGWEATFRAVTYGLGPMLLGVVPFCGSWIGIVWSMVLTPIALWQVQRTSGGRAAGAALTLPILASCCCCFGLAFLMASAIAGTHGGTL